jgi:hypothetical protein
MEEKNNKKKKISVVGHHLLFDKRFQSVRRLPQGQFTKYRQMFDAITRRVNKDKSSSARSSSVLSTDRLSINGPNLNKKTINNATAISGRKYSQNDVDDLIQTQLILDTHDRYKADDEHKNSFLLSSNSKKKVHLDEATMMKRIDTKRSESLVFAGISDETNQVLNKLCHSNKQIAEFLLESSQKEKQPDPGKSNDMNVYQAVPLVLVSEPSWVNFSSL